jgi:hypothetical protein
MSEANPSPGSTSLEDRYRVLLGIGHTLARTLSPTELYRSIYRETAQVMEAAGFYVALYDREKDLATVVFYADRGCEQAVEVTYRGSESEVLRTGRGSLVQDRLETRSLMVLGRPGPISPGQPSRHPSSMRGRSWAPSPPRATSPAHSRRRTWSSCRALPTWPPQPSPTLGMSLNSSPGAVSWNAWRRSGGPSPAPSIRGTSSAPS